jgi:hypothetical protein
LPQAPPLVTPEASAEVVDLRDAPSAARAHHAERWLWA